MLSENMSGSGSLVESFMTNDQPKGQLDPQCTESNVTWQRQKTKGPLVNQQQQETSLFVCKFWLFVVAEPEYVGSHCPGPGTLQAASAGPSSPSTLMTLG